MKKCSRCKENKSLSEFYVIKKSGALRPDCKVCVCKSAKAWRDKNVAHALSIKKIWRENNPEQYQRQTRQTNLARHGITSELYEDMRDKQKSRCAICNVHQDQLSRNLAIDHDHKCCPGARSCGKCIRGLVCDACNRGLGNFADDIDVVANALAYLLEAECQMMSNS